MSSRRSRSLSGLYLFAYLALVEPLDEDDICCRTDCAVEPLIVGLFCVLVVPVFLLAFDEFSCRLLVEDG